MMQREVLSEEIVRCFLESQFLKDRHLTRKEIQQRIRSSEWQSFFDALPEIAMENGMFHSVKVEEAARKHIGLFADSPPEGWVRHAFLYVRGMLFPGMEEQASDPERYEEGRAFFLQIMRGIYSAESAYLPFDPTYHMQLVDLKSPLAKGSTAEYGRFKRLVRSHYVYEFMRFGADITPFNTVGHMCGVHYVAMMMAYQLKKAGIPVDLGLISGAAAGHDIGKYGCRRNEERRVPYLHYYYTDYCYNRFGLPGMAHIAANHSTWDLELEDLSVEALLLIYADFRVKSIRENRDGESCEVIRFYSLDESYDVILSKLDNVDEAKKHRYEKVYSKLKDFERYMEEQGAKTQIPENYSSYEDCEPVREKRSVVFLAGTDIIDQLKFRAIDHNIRLMAEFHGEGGFGRIIESARSELQWKNLRTYLNILAEYSIYMPEKQKLLTLEFLYDLLSDREADIRGRAAEVLGRLIARFREEYKKELPEGIQQGDVVVTNVSLFEHYLKKIISPDKKLTDQHREWLQGCLHVFVMEVLRNCRVYCRHRYVEVFERCYRMEDISDDLRLVFLRALMDIDIRYCTDSFARTVSEFLEVCEALPERKLKVASALVRIRFFPGVEEVSHFDDLLALQREKYGDVSFDDVLNTMFLDDLKLVTPWVEKIANILLMKNYAMFQAKGDPVDQGRLLHIATHLGNLIKISSSVVTRLYAGKTLVQLVGKLSDEQRTEVAVELFNGLEIGDYQFSRYIPDYLGKILLYLPPKELDEFINDLKELMEEGSEMSAVSVVNTFYVAAVSYRNYGERFGEDAAVSEERKFRFLRLILKAFAGYNRSLAQEAFWVIGSKIFGSEELSLPEKEEIFQHCGKKLLMILDERKEKQLDFFNDAASLNHLYRFISEYLTEIGEIICSYPEKVAFFPGTFDPFSLGHKAVAKAIRDQGFEVYLALDEFSWSKNTQPHLERRKIMLMSTASEEHMYLFADDFPVNIDNPADLKKLKDVFAGREVYVAVGTDVIRNASCYRKKPVENSIHSMNHITFARASSGALSAREDEKVYPITGKRIHLSVKKYYEDISSTRIRENINRNRDISNLIDTFAQNYIYRKNLYQREPTYKHMLQAKEMSISELGTVPHDAAVLAGERLAQKGGKAGAALDYLFRPGVRGICIEGGTSERRLLGIAAAHRVDADGFYEEFRDVELAAHVRTASCGSAAVIGFFFPQSARGISNISQILLTELLTGLLAKGYTYAVYHPVDGAGDQESIHEALRRQGFVNIAESGKTPLLAVDMKAPNIIFRDVEAVIKSPFNKNPHVLRALEMAHSRLLHALTSICPGELVLSFNTNAAYNKIISKVAALNGVPNTPDPSGRKGPYLAAPYGKALRHVVVPNTVTKALHVEKYFYRDLKNGFRVAERYGYSSLDNQAAVLKSFHRPVILIEDLLHKGYRMNKLLPYLENAGVEVKAVVTGVLTGKARDHMLQTGRRVESAYYIPSINIWLNERDCYPFIGGDGIDIGEVAAFDTKSHSINLIMPYAYPDFIKRNDPSAVYRYSMACLENARDILKVLEEEYQRVFEKNLTLKRLGEVISNPKIPFPGAGINYDDSVAPSVFVESDIERLMRTGGKF